MRGPARPVPRGIPAERHALARAFAPGRRPVVREAAPRDAPSRRTHPSHLVGARLSRGARRYTPLAGRTLSAPARRRERTPPSLLDTHDSHPAADVPRQNSAPRRVSPLARHASLRTTHPVSARASESWSTRVRRPEAFEARIRGAHAMRVDYISYWTSEARTGARALRLLWTSEIWTTSTSKTPARGAVSGLSMRLRLRLRRRRRAFHSHLFGERPRR